MLSRITKLQFKSSNSEDDNLIRLLSTARDNLENEEYQIALDYYKEILEIDPLQQNAQLGEIICNGRVRGIRHFSMLFFESILSSALTYMGKCLGYNSVSYRKYYTFIIEEVMGLGAYFLWDILSYDKSEFFLDPSSSGLFECYKFYIFLYEWFRIHRFDGAILGELTEKDLQINCISNALIVCQYILSFYHSPLYLSQYKQNIEMYSEKLHRMENPK